MKKPLLLLFIAILNFNCYSQISFEKGYYINNANQRVDCLIKNVDWRNNPTEFEYKLSENGESKKESIESVKEFGVDNSSKYVRTKVNIDRSSEYVNELSETRAPLFIEEVLFLKVLVEGKASLYEFIDGGLERYFYMHNNNAIEQLIFKSYKVQDRNVYKNSRFKQQLWTDLKCPAITLNKIKNLDYKRKDLVKFFVNYHECNNLEYVNYVATKKRDAFNLNSRPGLNYSTLSIQNSILKSRNIDFDNDLTFRMGIEAEFIFPFNKSKWAIIIEPTYQYYKSEKKVPNLLVNVNYQSIELPIGIRHYFFLNEKAKIFINGSIITDLSFNSGIKFSPGSTFDIKSQNNLAFGIGYKHINKFSIELRYQTRREIIRDYISYRSDYNTVSVIFGYSLF